MNTSNMHIVQTYACLNIIIVIFLYEFLIFPLYAWCFLSKMLRLVQTRNIIIIIIIIVLFVFLFNSVCVWCLCIHIFFYVHTICFALALLKLSHRYFFSSWLHSFHLVWFSLFIYLRFGIFFPFLSVSWFFCMGEWKV